MLERVWRKGNPLTLLVGMHTSTATMENSVENTWNLEIGPPYDPAISLLGIHSEKTRIERSTCTLMFISALFIIARTWKQPRCLSADEWIRKQWYIYTMEYYSAIKKEYIWISSNEVDETGAYYIEWSKSERKTPYSTLMHIYGI